MGTATAIGSAPRKTPAKKFSKTSLGGTDLKRRAGAQKAGNQMRTPNIYEMAIKATKEKMKKSGRTDTGQRPNLVDTEPDHKSMTGYN